MQMIQKELEAIWLKQQETSRKTKNMTNTLISGSVGGGGGMEMCKK
jgi:hypothetical protein